MAGCTAWEAWSLVLSLGDVDILANDVIDEFMRILKRNGFLTYHLNKPTEPVTILVPGEKFVGDSEAAVSAEGIVIEGEEVGCSNWESDTPPQDGIILVHIDQYEATMVVPIIWEGSVRKVLSEYLSLKYIMMDIPEAEPSKIAQECARRMKSILNKTSSSWGYATPYLEFVNAHMHEYNQLMVAAIATPAGLPVHLVEERAQGKQLKLRVSFEGVRISEVQWPKRLDVIRFLDENHQLLKLDWKQMLDSEVVNRLYDIEEIQDVQHQVSRTLTATLLAGMENNVSISDPQTTLAGHLEFIQGNPEKLVQPLTFQEFLAIYAKYEKKHGGPIIRLRNLVQPWKGTPPRGIQIKWKGDVPYLTDPTENLKKRYNKRSFNKSAPLPKRHKCFPGHTQHYMTKNGKSQL